MNLRILPLVVLLSAAATLPAQEQVAIVRKDGLLVILPEVAGRRSYGTYLVPNELGREQIDRFIYLGNPLQINFLGAQEFGRGFTRMKAREKLQEFLRVESQYLSEAFNQTVQFTDVQPSRHGAVEYLSGTITLTAPDGKLMTLRLTARTAGGGILHAGYQVANPATLGQAQAMVDRLLQSFRLVRRPLTPNELAAISRKAKA